MLLVAGAAVLVATGSSSKQQLPGGDKSIHNARLDGLLLQPVRQAPALASLHNSLGQPVNLAAYRGKAVFVTFLYTHCPDVCPLIASQLHNGAQSRLGARRPTRCSWWPCPSIRAGTPPPTWPAS